MRTAQYSVSTTPVKIADQAGSARKISIHNETVASYLGDRNVTSSTGYKMDANDKITLDVNGGSELWLVTSTGTAAVTVFEN
jgi:hypothetical protein